MLRGWTAHGDVGLEALHVDAKTDGWGAFGLLWFGFDLVWFGLFGLIWFGLCGFKRHVFCLNESLVSLLSLWDGLLG